MKESRVETIRNVALVSYTGAGKTSLVEALLYARGAIPSMGSIGHGNTVSDFEPEEIHRKVSVNATVSHFTWKDTTFNLIDTPGALSLLGEAKTALRAADGVLIVVAASSGVRTELENIWNTITELQLPCLIFINELDKERAAVEPALDECEKTLEMKGLPVMVPIGSASLLEGMIDVIRGISYRTDKDSLKVQQGDVPTSIQTAVAEARRRLVEGVAETDDRLLEKYLAEGDLETPDLIDGLTQGSRAKKIVPVLCGSATRLIGISALLDALATYLPSPVEQGTRRPLVGTSPQEGSPISRHPTSSDPLSGYIFKTIIDPFMGRLSYARILSGVLQASQR